MHGLPIIIYIDFHLQGGLPPTHTQTLGARTPRTGEAPSTTKAESSEINGKTLKIQLFPPE
jgi:hypothetical protein